MGGAGPGRPSCGASGCGRATAGSRWASRSGWPSAHPTCSGRATGLDARASTSPASTASSSVDPGARTADVQGMTTYEHLVDATLPHGADAPGRAAAEDDHARRRGHRARHRVVVVPQRPAARVGPRDGDPHRRRRGRRGPPDNEHADLFRAFPNSYGTLGYALRLRIELEPRAPLRPLRHVRFHDLDALMGALGDVVRTAQP